MQQIILSSLPWDSANPGQGFDGALLVLKDALPYQYIPISTQAIDAGDDALLAGYGNPYVAGQAQTIDGHAMAGLGFALGAPTSLVSADYQRALGYLGESHEMASTNGDSGAQVFSFGGASIDILATNFSNATLQGFITSGNGVGSNYLDLSLPLSSQGFNDLMVQGKAAVPEPTSLAILGVMSLVLLGRRNRVLVAGSLERLQ